jgi:hypothetical protein
MKTRYRKDIGAAELTLLARFSRALKIVASTSGGSIVWLLGEQELWLPLWYQAGNSWRISCYRPFLLEAIAIQPRDLKRICKYLQVAEPELVKVLFNTGTLAVVPDQKPLDKPVVRIGFTGKHFDNEGLDDPETSVGFVLARHRAEGIWKRKQEASDGE